jgi:hypothetical protein
MSGMMLLWAAKQSELADIVAIVDFVIVWSDFVDLEFFIAFKTPLRK